MNQIYSTVLDAEDAACGSCRDTTLAQLLIPPPFNRLPPCSNSSTRSSSVHLHRHLHLPLHPRLALFSTGGCYHRTNYAYW
ncbi:hypothetical protein I7I50_10960 [Histoplasma capsulatum G186AR]|uniref:Uncharacterized protein n=1 Tax=Ajellomyces capsulatus TaxID=5037 RepID=A0A8H7Z748_AJECA|nr:hypothetical protein I7I52_02198 [Histoplasma capsulatum]QSS69610.1 hypothetical protein I7I50_10960 [Histoplasma capsulatum G186AR]